MTTRTSTNVGAEPTAVPAVERTRGARRTVAGAAAFVILLAVAAAILVPIVYAVLGGFKDNGQLNGNPVALLPDPWVFENYADVLWGEDAPAFWGELLNSVIVAIIAVGVTVGCASAAARRCTHCSCSGCSSRPPSRSCRCMSSSARSGCRAACWGWRSRRPP